MKRKGRFTKTDFIRGGALILVSLAWGGAAGVIVKFKYEAVALEWFLLIYLMCLFNLYCLMKSVAYLQKIVSQTQGNQKGKALVGLVLWGSLKVFCLGLIGWSLWKGHPGLTRQAAQFTGLLAASTMVVVPILGGLLWSFGQQTSRT